MLLLDLCGLKAEYSIRERSRIIYRITISVYTVYLLGDGRRDCVCVEPESRSYFNSADRKYADSVGGQMCVGESLTVLFRF